MPRFLRTVADAAEPRAMTLIWANVLALAKPQLPSLSRRQLRSLRPRDWTAEQSDMRGSGGRNNRWRHSGREDVTGGGGACNLFGDKTTWYFIY